MTTLRQLGYIVALEETRHFRRAAEKCGVSQPTLSNQVAVLEQHLGAELFDRQRSRVVPTPVGREIVQRARLVLAEVRDLERRAGGRADGLRGTLCVGVVPTLGPYLLPHVVPDLHRMYPDLKLFVREAPPRVLRDELVAGGCDVVLTPLPFATRDFCVVRLFREPLLIVAAPDHRLAGRGNIARGDLAGESVLVLAEGYHLHDQVRDLCDAFGADVHRDYEGTSLDALRVMVGMGAGISFLPALYVRSEITPRNEVAILRLKARELYRDVGMVWRRNDAQDAAFRRIAALIGGIARARVSEIAVRASAGAG